MKTNLAVLALMVSAGVSFGQAPSAMSISGTVIQANADGVLIDAQKTGRRIGAKAIEGVVMVRGVFGVVGTEIKSSVVPDGLFDYTTVTGASMRVLCFKLPGAVTAAPSAPTPGRAPGYSNPLESAPHSQTSSSRKAGKLKPTE